MPLPFLSPIHTEPLRQEELFFIVLLPSGSGFVFVRECFGDVVLCFRAPERAIRRFLRFFGSFLKIFLAPIKRTD